MTTSWAGKTLTWNNRPGHTAGTAEIKPQSLKNYNFNVTAIVNAWYNGSPKYGFMISYYNEGARDLNSLYSSDCGNNTYLPVLTFNYVTGPALSAVTAGVYYIRNQYSGKYIDVNGQYTTAGANVHQWSFHGGPSQQWKITHVGNNWYTIRPQHAPGMAMDVLDNSPNNTANIIQHKFHGARCQQFGFIKNANGSYRIVTKTTNGTRCLAVQYALTTDGGNIFQYNYGSQANDHWFLEWANSRDTDGDGIPDGDDVSPLTKYRPPVFLIHGRTSNSEGTWGIKNAIPAGQNNHFNSLVSESALNGKKYTDIDSQRITGFLANPGGTERPVYLGNVLKSAGYKENISLFAFNYPNEDAVVHSAKKFDMYITNLIRYVRTSGTTEMKGCFFRTRADYNSNNYKINLVGHSMGGLVSRYYIENLKHDNQVNKLITIDTPHWGSGLADPSNAIGSIFNMHILADHDLSPSAPIFKGGSSDPKITHSGCSSNGYSITPQLSNPSNRSTKYYAIAGLDFNGYANDYSYNDYGFEIPTSYTTFRQISDLIVITHQISCPDYIGSHYPDIYNDGDLVVDFPSQIGWKYNGGITPAQKVKMEKIFVNFDLDNGNSAFDNLHSKMQHRINVTNKLVEYLSN